MVLIRNYFIKFWLLSIVALMVGGCVFSSTSGVVGLYDLSPAVIKPAKGFPTPVQLIIPTPNALAALDNQFVAIRPSRVQIAYFGNAQWSDALPRLVQTRIIDAFTKSNTFRSVSEPGLGISSDYQLLINIDNFQIERGGDDQFVADIGLRIKLVNEANGRVLASRSISRIVPATGDKIADAIPALNKAFAAVVTELVKQTAKYLRYR